ncbi:hypothetical protein SNE40_018898 [Patella caerulea]|uniref:DNA-dependent protein kinase catalytic subunit n=1 Tax=Patella caerulea TaxID=87958 RepID=A0AAN8J8T5_PATCE
MATGLLEESLWSLHKSLGASGEAERDQAETVVGNITQICLHEISLKDIDYCCSVLFDKEIGIIAYLQKISKKNEYQGSGAKYGLLEFLSGFIHKVDKKIIPYAVEIKEVCILNYSTDRFAKIRNAALPVLIKILELSVGTDLGEDLQIKKLIDKFFMELTKGSKLTASVKGSIYYLLGVIAEVYPEHMMTYSSRLLDLYKSALKQEMTAKTKKPELTVISGCLSGLTAYLINFTQSSEDGSCYDIYKYAKMAIDPSINLSRYEVPKAGLILFSKHASQLREFFIDDYQVMYERLCHWSHHRNREVLNIGMSAMEAFLKEISEMLVQKSGEGLIKGAVFKFFMQQFRSIMNSSEANSKEISLAIRGYGLLAAPCKSFLKANDVQFMFSEMITKCEQQFFGNTDDLQDKLHSLHSYLEALANIINEVNEVSDTFASIVEHLLVLQLENIPSINEKIHYSCIRSVIHVLLSLMAKGSTFHQVLSGVVYQSVIRTCSHPIVLETEQTEEDLTAVDTFKEKNISYRNYLDVWTHLLESAKIKDLSTLGISIEERTQLTDAVYNELMTAILKVLNKLDLTSTSSTELTEQVDGASTSADVSMETDDVSADPTVGVQATKPKDFQVFINLVDFCRDLLPTKCTELFEKWIFTFSHNIILLSTKNPLVSGFYKFLAMCMKISNKLSYFQSVAPISPSKSHVAMETEDSNENEKQKAVCYLLVKKFSKEVLVRMKQYQDDLLAACLTFVLSLPKEIITEQMIEVVPAVQVALSLGLSYLPLAGIAIDALEYWCHNLPHHIIHPHYSAILPYLDNYIKTVDKGAEEIKVESTVSTGKGKKKLPIRLIRKQKIESEKSYESKLAVVKQRVVQYLGSLGGSVNYALLANSEEEISKQAIAWDTNKHLRFDIPFIDMKPIIYFDPFLPHVVELAMKSSDRQTKVAACELLHSLILYCLGRCAQQPGEQQKRYPMEAIYKKLFPAMLQLACDVELVSKQLFEPLTMQIIHWFTNNKMAESMETMALLDTIFDSIIQSSDTALRDFSAKCLREFLKWSLKQSSVKATEKSPVNTSSMLKRIFSFALHPSAFKRLGAALAFNNVYQILREEKSLVDRYIFQILVHFVESLSLAHQDEKSLGTQEQCVAVLDHLQRIIIFHADLLSKQSKLRPEPREWSSKTLDIAVRWLSRQCGRPQTECRHACMKLVYQLCTHVPGIKATKDYFGTFLKTGGAPHFISRFEGGGTATHGKSGISACPTMIKISEVFSLTSALNWFDMLLAALDCYTWVFGEGLLTPSDLLSEKAAKTSKVFESLKYFLKHVALSEIGDAAKLFKKNVDADLFTPLEIEQYNRNKCTVIVRLWNFVAVIVGKYPKEAFKVIPQDIWSEDLWELLIKCVVQPQAVGFNMGDIEIINKLPTELEQVLMIFNRYLPENHSKDLKIALRSHLQGDRDLFGLLPISLNDPGVAHNILHHLVIGYSLLNKTRLLQHIVQTQNKPQLLVFNTVYNGVFEKKGSKKTVVSLTPTALGLGRSLLELSFQLDLPATILIESLLNQDDIQNKSMNVQLQHGDLFFTRYKSTICHSIAEQAETVIPLLADRAVDNARKISSFLVATVDYIARDRILRKKEGAKVASIILSQWDKFSIWWTNKASAEFQSLAISLLTKVLLIDSKVTSHTSHPSFSTIFDMYEIMLTDRRTNLAFKNHVLDLLPFFAMSQDTYIKKLKVSLDRLVADNFPLKSSEFTQGSPRYNDYILALKKILVALELSGSPMLLELLISIFCRENKHAYEDEIQAVIARYTRRLPQDKQKLALDVPHAIFIKEGSFPPAIRTAAMERVCLPMLRLVRKSALIEFFQDHIKHMMTEIEAKLIKTSASQLENQLVTKMGCFQQMELLYSRLSKDEVYSKNSIINEKYCSGHVETGKEMTQKLTKCAHDARSEDTRGETMLVELRRLYHCSAYNLMISIISCTQTDVKFYQGFLLSDKEDKGQFVLENIVDKDKKYEFSAELESLMERKKRFVSIRSEVKEKRTDDVEESMFSSFSLTSQYMDDSSLSDDLNQFDFMAGTAQMMSGSVERDRLKGRSELTKKSSYPNEPEDTATLSGDYLELEMDELNQHECMAQMIALLKHLHTTITPPEKGTIPKEMPKWMQFFHKKMKDPTTNINIKLFIAKLIINTSEVFQPYTKFWLPCLCQLIFSGPMSSGGINFFITDIIVTMMSWHTISIPQDTLEERAMASRLVQFLMANIYHTNRSIYKNNLEMLKTLLECWKDRIEIPYKIVYNHLKSEECSVGVQLLGVIITCKFPPYGPDAPVDREKFFITVGNIIGAKSKPVYTAASEVVGMILRYLAEKEKETDGEFHDYLVKQISSLQFTKPDNFIVCVNRLNHHYEAIADRFLNKILYMLPSLSGDFRTQCLVIINSRIEQIDNVFMELKSKGLISFLTHRNEDTQLESLNIITSIRHKLKASEMNSLMEAITAFTHHPSTPCRKIMYELLMWIYDNYREDESEESHAIMQKTKETLLKGLGDDDILCRLLVQNFWSSETRLPTGTLDRMVAMLEAMYSPSTEQQYLSYSTSLLLEMTSKSPDYQREIFEHPLSECKFQEFSVRSSWKQRHAAMTPLFASSLSTQSESMEGVEDSLDGGVRATQVGQQFTATMDAGSGAPFNWLTQSSLDTYGDYSTVGQETPSSLLFSVGSTDSQSTSASRRSRPGFGLPRKPTPQKPGKTTKNEETVNGPGSEMWRLKRRFLKDQQSTSVYFAKRQMNLNKRREELMKEQRSRRENQVTMYRKYRSGDLPDIQIKYSYLIAPLQALAHRDSTIAKLLFSSVFKAIFKKMDEVKTEREIEETTSQINRSMETIFNTTAQYYPPFLGCIMNILYELRSSIKVNPSSLSTGAIVSNLQPLGITVLEEQLIQTDNVDPRPTKRGRTTTGTQVSLDVNQWIEMARLYKSVNQYDVLHGIFSGKIDTKSITQEAMIAEAKGDYQTANRLYDEALSKEDWDDGDPLTAEVDLWDDSRMECLDHLTQWTDLEAVSVAGVDTSTPPDLNKVWDDTFCQEHFLPYLIRSKLKLMLQSEGEQSLLTFVDKAMQNLEHRAVLESRYSMELALMYLWQEDYDRARHYAGIASQKFLQEWSSTDSLMITSRTSQLQQLQPLVELQEFLQFMAKDSNMTHTNANQLIRTWETRQPHQLLDPVTIWDDVITNRNVYLDHICHRLNTKNRDSQEDDEEDLFEESKLRLKLAMAQSCKGQNNFALTLRILKKTNTMCKTIGNEQLNIEWSQLYASTHHKKAICSEWSEDTFNSVITTIDQLGKYKDCDAFSQKPDLCRRHHVLTGISHELLADACLTANPSEHLSGKTQEKLLQLSKIKKLNQTEVVSSLIEKGYQELRAAVSDGIVTRSRSESFTQADAQMALCKFCDKFLRTKEEDEEHIDSKVLESYPETITVCLLKAMKLGSKEAIERFPRLLQLVELYPDTMAAFVNKASEVPSWMFLLWISQMMALMDKVEASAVQPILLQLATDYPQAVVYPFRISCEGFEFDNSTQGKKNKQSVEKLASLLTEERVPLVGKFISALDQFAQPEMLFKDWTDDIRKMLMSKTKARDKIMEKYKEIYNILIDYKDVQDVSSSQMSFLSQSTTVGMGDYRKKFAEIFKKDFISTFGKNGEKLVNMTAKEFQSQFIRLNGEFDKHKKPRGKLIPPTSLREYCQWLADFNPNRDSRELEIPGQYDGLAKPLPEYHIRVAGFDERVLVMSSLRKPKRITVRGNDEKDYHYLVKGGEDLRQDARIEQLFVIMNKVFSKDPACRHRKLKLKTYQVIPMTPRVGLIEWMNNTIPLKDFVLNALTEQERKYVMGEQGPMKQHEKWTYRYWDDKKKSIAGMYSKVYMNYSRADTIKEQRLKENKVPWDLFRRAFHQMSTSPEAFHVLRCELIVTHAVICICQYFLGIGDRHLSNFMINLKSGGMVGIDFGHNFGSATQFLPVPELMPFRLTRQIVNLCLPLPVKGLLESTMVHTLRALRIDYDLLVNTMDVFVKEPSLDWLNFAEKQMNEKMGPDDDEIDATWYPKQKIEYAQRKLKGDNPCYITRDELTLGHQRNAAFKSFLEVVLGDKKDNVRATLPKTGLSCEQQVAALIDQATDPNILGRVWQGWEAWI